MTLVLDATFVYSAPTMKVCQPAVRPELAFIGRSNVGKSSLLTALMNRKGLVKVSKTPGRTRALNFFDVTVRDDDERQHELSVVDLPGYGYARVQKSERAQMTQLLSDYLGAERPGLAAVCQLFDARHAPSAEDLEIARGLSEMPYLWIPVATKIDKLAPNKRLGARKQVAKAIGVRSTDVTLFSAPEKIGREELWERLLLAVAERAAT